MRFPLYLGAVYFLAMALAHTFCRKIPGLFLYFDVPSNAYQDRVIGILAFGWSLMFFQAAHSGLPVIRKSILVLSFVAMTMLAHINLTTDFRALALQADPRVYHVEVGILFMYWLWLLWGYLSERQMKAE